MPRFVGAWMCGLYDNDKLVIRAARDSFAQVFHTEGKQQNVWKLCHYSILEFCSDVILKESSRTLSDERTTSPDDAEGKYARVVGSAIVVITQTLGMLSKNVWKRKLLTGLRQRVSQLRSLTNKRFYTKNF